LYKHLRIASAPNAVFQRNQITNSLRPTLSPIQSISTFQLSKVTATMTSSPSKASLLNQGQHFSQEGRTESESVIVIAKSWTPHLTLSLQWNPSFLNCLTLYTKVKLEELV